MKKLILISLLTSVVTLQAQWANFYIRPGGSKLNGGTGNTDAALVSGSNGGFTNGVYKFASAVTLTSDMTNHCAAFYADGGTIPTWIAYITAVDDTLDSITVTRTQSKSGTEITTSANGISCNIGGAWTLATSITDTNRFPFHFMPAGNETFANFNVGLTNRQGHPARLLIKGSGDYTAIDYALIETTNTAPGTYTIKGWTNSIEDNGLARIQLDTNAAFNGRTPLIWSGTGTPFIRNLWTIDDGKAASGSTHNNGSWNFTTIVDIRSNIFQGSWDAATRIGGAGSTVEGNLYISNCWNAASGECAIKLATSATIRNNVIAFQEFRFGDNGACGCGIVGSSSLPMEIEGNIFYKLWGAGIEQSGNAVTARIRNNVFKDLSLYGVNVPFSTAGATNVSALEVSGNIFVNMNTGIRYVSGQTMALWSPVMWNNAFYNCTNGNIAFWNTNNIANTIQLTGDPFTGAGVFELNSTAGAGAALKGINGGYYPLTGQSLFSSVTDSYRDIGPVQSTNASSGGTTSYIFGSH